jgi:rhamnosyltransferase
MDIAAVAILYHPDAETKNRINSYIHKVKKLYIIDNTEGSPDEEIGQFAREKNARYLHDGENRGISKRLNQAIVLALADGFEWLLTMDQDSYFEEGTMDTYFHCVHQFEAKSQVGMFGVEFNAPLGNNNNCGATETDHLITSGSIVNLAVCKKIGGFDEALFIDWVDQEFCYRAITNNFRIIKFQNILLRHQLGKVQYKTSFKSLKKTPRTLHSPIRIYYMVRNFLYLKKKYKDHCPGLREQQRVLSNRLKNNFLYGNKLVFLKYVLKAIFDYRSARMGKIQE